MVRRIRGSFLFLVFGLLFITMTYSVSAATLGVNYYHESMISGVHEVHYIERSLEEVSRDLDDIKKVTNHVKFYMNPYAEGNLEWIEKIAKVAKDKNMHVAVAMNVDDRNVDWSTKDEYYSLVKEAARRLDKKVDVFIVGNEIALHTTMQRSEIRSYVEPLMDEVRTIFDKEVSYEVFWWAKDSWKGYDKGKLYLNMYEEIDSFKNNLKEFNTSFGGHHIGEWGDDFYEGSTNMGEEWQADQHFKRWDEITKTNADVAYVFAYREPSTDGFSIIRNDGTPKAFWEEEISKATKEETSETEESDSSDQESEDVFTMSELSPFSTVGKLASEEDLGSCKSANYESEQGDIKIMACDKGDKVEVYRQDYPEGLKFEAGFNNLVIDEIGGFASLAKEEIETTADATTKTTKTQEEGSNLAEINTHSDKGTKISDKTDGGCRSAVYDTSKGEIEIKACQKNDNLIEIYRINFPSSLRFSAGFAGISVDEIRGFNEIWL